tara:strand:- start:1099 stop:2262 length:1164 start_codon:yes stop_codon:yes gene_type:complete
MKKKVIIVGSTGSIGVNTLKVIRNNKKDFEILLLSTNKNVKRIIAQAKEFKVKNVIINDLIEFRKAQKKYKKLKIKFFNEFDSIKKILRKKKVYYSMISVSGLDGLKPTIILSNYSNNLAIVNKESLICGWNLIKNALKKNKCNFIPIDSEHYSIHSLLKGHQLSEIEKIYITASGGPFINIPKKKFNHIRLKDALRHPNWKMGKKITVDSSTLMNKVFEVIEARNIFNIDYKKISILTHPKSYVHAIVKFNNGLSKILLHEPDMKIPIYNSLNLKNKKIRTLPLKFDTLNKLNFNQVDNKKFPLVNIIYKLPKKISLFETVLITVNDYFVNKFLEKKISYKKLIAIIIKILNMKEFQKYKKIKPKNIEDIYRLRDYVSFKMDSLSI